MNVKTRKWGWVRGGPLRAVLGLFVIAGLAACASGGGGGDGAPRRRANVITYEELVDIDVTDAFQAVQRLRPAWFRTRTGTMPAVFLNGTDQGIGVERLRTILVTEVETLTNLSASDATTRFGTGYLNGAILVETRNR